MTQETPMLNALIDRCCRWINVLIALALAVMVVMVFGNVVLRYAFNSGIAVSEEVSRLLLLLNLWRLLSGQVPDDQLVQTSGSEDVATLPDMQLDRAALPSRKPPSH